MGAGRETSCSLSFICFFWCEWGCLFHLPHLIFLQTEWSQYCGGYTSQTVDTPFVLSLIEMTRRISSPAQFFEFMRQREKVDERETERTRILRDEGWRRSGRMGWTEEVRSVMIVVLDFFFFYKIFDSISKRSSTLLLILTFFIYGITSQFGWDSWVIETANSLWV